MVIRAVVKDGALLPLEPLPHDWHNGREVDVELRDVESVTPERRAQIKAWVARVKSHGGMDAEDQARFQAAVEEERRLGKEYCD